MLALDGETLNGRARGIWSPLFLELHNSSIRRTQREARPQTIGSGVMFGKAKPPRDQLGERMRRAVAQKIEPPPTSYPWSRQIERAVRLAVFRQGALILADGEKQPVVVKDISATGARIEYFVRRELPDFITLVEPTLRIKSLARVIWQRDGIAGLAFVRD
ncbi:hypothetical protein U91I_03512 [alpha proteobacterium U9-1i]|nr:hypothetical protein U91I_03512 [alpha proteobacterium U9-1i]